MTLALVLVALIVGAVAGLLARPYLDTLQREHERRELPPDRPDAGDSTP